MSAFSTSAPATGLQLTESSYFSSALMVSVAKPDLAVTAANQGQAGSLLPHKKPLVMVPLEEIWKATPSVTTNSPGNPNPAQSAEEML